MHWLNYIGQLSVNWNCDSVQFIDGEIYLNGNQILKTLKKKNDFVYCGNNKIEVITFEEKLPSGKTYIGKFVAGYEHGEGTCFNEDGSAISCTMDIGVTSGKETYDISLEARKWVKVNEYESTSGKGKKIIDLLESNFKIKALEFCASTGNYKTLEKKVEVLCTIHYEPDFSRLLHFYTNCQDCICGLHTKNTFLLLF